MRVKAHRNEMGSEANGKISLRNMDRSMTSVEAYATVGRNSVVVLECQVASLVFGIV